MNSGFVGIWPILYAFFGADGRLDRSAMRREVDACIAGGARGIAVLGLATEVGKLTGDERRSLVQWAAEDVNGRVPLAVTISGATVEAQRSAIGHARDHGAALVILQPPAKAGLTEDELAGFFDAVMADADIPIGVQNAPDYLGIGLDAGAVARLADRHGQFRVLKGEGPAVTVQQMIETTGERLAVFNGRGGLEIVDSLRAGCAGLIPAPDCFDAQVLIYEAFRNGRLDLAEQLYQRVAPVIIFAMASLDHLVCYGKRIVAARLGLGPVHDRTPSLAPTPFGEAAVARYAAALGPYS